MAANKRHLTGAQMRDQVLDKISKFSDKNRATAERVHQLIMEANPNLWPRLWYGMPGYAASKDSAVLCFFREDEKYMTLGLTESVDMAPETKSADLLMPCAWYFTDLNTATEQKIKQIIQKHS